MGERRDEQEERLEKSADLDFLGRDLTSLALKGELSPVYLRKDIIEKIKAFLNDKIYFILVGKPGTGKNAVVYGMICEMVKERAYHYYNFYINKENQIQNYIPQNLIFVYECEPSAFERDCLYAHEFETKFRKVIENCKKKNAILFIDNIHLAVYAGCTGENLQQNVANYLKGVIERNEVFVFGATTPEGYTVKTLHLLINL
jgi:ATP-dependent Clp protease ATP-binding subunit ClpA